MCGLKWPVTRRTSSQLPKAIKWESSPCCCMQLFNNEGHPRGWPRLDLSLAINIQHYSPQSWPLELCTIAFLILQMNYAVCFELPRNTILHNIAMLAGRHQPWFTSYMRLFIAPNTGEKKKNKLMNETVSPTHLVITYCLPNANGRAASMPDSPGHQVPRLKTEVQSKNWSQLKWTFFCYLFGAAAVEAHFVIWIYSETCCSVMHKYSLNNAIFQCVQLPNSPKGFHKANFSKTNFTPRSSESSKAGPIALRQEDGLRRKPWPFAKKLWFGQ